MGKISEFFENRRLKRFERKMKELKPRLLSKWYDDQEETIRGEYEESMDKLETELFMVRKELRETVYSRDYYKGKYEGVIEMQDKVQDKLINKIEVSGTQKGQLKQEVKQLKEEAKTTDDAADLPKENSIEKEEN